MRFLIDTNIFIPLEPTRYHDIEPGMPAAMEFFRLAVLTGCHLFVHPNMRDDISRDSDSLRRQVRRLQLLKYSPLPDPPQLSESLELVLGRATPHSNDWVDNSLIAALHANAVDFLVTEDNGIRKKANKLEFGERILNVAEAITFLKRLFDQTPAPPPEVLSVKAHSLDERDPIFDSLRQDYPGFDTWLVKCKLEHRQAWVVKENAGELCAVCIVNSERTEAAVGRKVLKICTFKVGAEYAGQKYGELLLKTVFRYAKSNQYTDLFVTVFEKQELLIELLFDFGFRREGEQTNLGEIILRKRMICSPDEVSRTEPLLFNILYGPCAIRVEGVPAFVVPIQPRFHQMLFPESRLQLALFRESRPYGNCIRKAYLCGSRIKSISPGSNLLFYRSEDRKDVRHLGVVEKAFFSQSDSEIIRAVGKRTVYGYEAIREMCVRPVLTILFRESLELSNPISLDELIRNGLLTAAPQSITKLPGEGSAWLGKRIAQ